MLLPQQRILKKKQKHLTPLLEIAHLDTTVSCLLFLFAYKPHLFPLVLCLWNSFQTDSNEVREAFTSAVYTRDEDALSTQTIQNPAHK